MKYTPKEGGIVQKEFFKFIPLFLGLTLQIVCQYPRLDSI